jgi:hypothetical protein
MLFFLLSQNLTFNLNPHHAWLETAKKKYKTHTDDYGNAATLFFQFVSSLDKGTSFESRAACCFVEQFDNWRWQKECLHKE